MAGEAGDRRGEADIVRNPTTAKVTVAGGDGQSQARVGEGEEVLYGAVRVGRVWRARPCPQGVRTAGWARRAGTRPRSGGGRRDEVSWPLGRHYRGGRPGARDKVTVEERIMQMMY